MSSTEPTFVEQCINGSAKLTDIDDFIDRWHNGPVEGCELHDFLGMTWEEYKQFVEDESRLPGIISSHRENRPMYVTRGHMIKPAKKSPARGEPRH